MARKKEKVLYKPKKDRRNVLGKNKTSVLACKIKNLSVTEDNSKVCPHKSYEKRTSMDNSEISELTQESSDM